MMEASREPASGAHDPVEEQSMLSSSRSKLLGVKLGALAVMLASAFSIAGYVSTYLSFDASSVDPSGLVSRAARTNAVAAAILAFVCVYVAGLVLARSILRRLEKFNIATREASAGNLEIRVDTSTGLVFENLARNFNAMMDRMNLSAHAEAAQKQSLLAIIKAIESSGDAIAVADASRERTYYNKRFVELFGYSIEELTNNKPVLYVDP